MSFSSSSSVHQMRDTRGLHICAVSATQGRGVCTGVAESEEPHLIQDREPGKAIIGGDVWAASWKSTS